MILESILSGLVLFGSFSLRTPNIQPNLDDYEISIGIKDPNFYINRQWERELGEYYIDDEVWFEYSPAMLYIKPQYVNKTSKDLQYGKMDMRYKRGWFSVGYALMYSDFENMKANKIEKSSSFGIHKKIFSDERFNIEVKLNGYYVPVDEETSSDRLDAESYIQLKWLLTDNLSLYNLLDYNNIKRKEFYKFKIGIEFKL